ncbi:MAG: helix-hairpin-helix domain-containing protein [Bacteroidales bacterium]|nr:helix-hairpin-helix domain-containing protein [Bacteroidales bacterium]
MESSEKKKSGLSESFVIGVIAIVFLIIGYQTALFIHRAAVMKITANRDEPDTVYVRIPISRDSIAGRSESGISGEETEIVRSYASHSRRAQTVRTNVPRKTVETFRFDPNTASVEDLCRLGFSPKQAQSIDNYRKKGGRFRRKEDFAKSYVVADSIFRRLEAYIDIPLVDLNVADSAAFDALPGIGGWFATKMIEHRKALGGYSYKEQLMDIYRFDQEKFDGLKDLVTVSPENAVPYPLWTLPADSLRAHPYIRNLETAKAIVLYRETTPPDRWTIEALRDAGILTVEQYNRLSPCLIALH